ncbi:MAG: small multidrug resistance pump [Pseudohongiellaceae bacterium]|jgi:small multidrug resistance pump
MSYLYLSIAIIAEVIATSALKSSQGFTRPWASIVVVLGYGIAFYCLSIVLKTIPIGIAYAIWAGLGVVLITIVGYFFYQQKLDIAAVVGMSLIVAGVLIINIFSTSLAH